MNLDGSFTDLRLNRQEGQNQESFWPSFTDIMTVIVMIFMIAMVVLLLRNMELVRQLRATMEAERQAVELARSTGEEKESLALRLIDAENRLSMLNIRLMQLDEERTRQSTTIGTQGEQITRLLNENEALTLRRDQLSAENYALGERLTRSERRLSSLQQEREGLRESLELARQQQQDLEQLLADTQADLGSLRDLQLALQQQLETLRQRYNLQAQELAQSRDEQRAAGQRLNLMTRDYDQLKVKYDELVRPARSPEGRYLVEVRYSKLGDRFQIEFASADQADFQVLTREQLDQRLEALLRAHSNGLYVKVIIPEESGLTYNEAWSFTSDLHARFDYYSQRVEPPLPAE